MERGTDLRNFPVHLGLGAKSKSLSQFTGLDWYDAYEKAHSEDGNEGRLITLFEFDEPWSNWEVHPHGSEVVICLSGELTLIQQTSDGKEKKITLKANEYAINPAGVWHTADADHKVSVLFITCGVGTEHRDR